VKSGRPIRLARTARQANEWALVLGAAGIPHAVTSDDDGGFVLLVAADDVDRAETVLAAYDREAGDAAAAVSAPPPQVAPYPWMSGVTVGLFLLGMFAVTGQSASRSHWFERGAAVAGRVFGDEPWRAVTALTLHADAVHVLQNAVATAVLLPWLVQRLGVGGALGVTLLSGAVGNLLSAIVHDSRHVAIGFSTAAFGIIGLLASLRLIASRTPGASGRRGWVVVAATVLLLVMLGTARDADVVAHVLGLCVGGVFGLAAGILVRRPPSPPVQWALTMLTALAVAGAWHLALSSR
jgi:membrane associated rhomboid family serine protease